MHTCFFFTFAAKLHIAHLYTLPQRFATYKSYPTLPIRTTIDTIWLVNKVFFLRLAAVWIIQVFDYEQMLSKLQFQYLNAVF